MAKKIFILIFLLLAISLLCGCAELFDANMVIERDPFIPQKGTPVPEPNAPLLKTLMPIIPEVSESPFPITSTNPLPTPVDKPTEVPAPSMTPTPTQRSTPSPDKTQEPAPEPTLIPPVIEIIPKIGILSDSSDKKSYSFSNMAWNAIKEASADFGYEPVFLEVPAMDDGTILAHIEKLVKSECELIVLPNNKFKDALKAAREIYPEIYFILIEFDGVLGSNAVTVSFSEFQAGFMAAAAAASELSSSLGIQSVDFGIIIEEDNLTTQMYAKGFSEGLLFVSEHYGIETVLNPQYIVFLNEPGNPESARYASYGLYDSGVDCILNLAGSSYEGVIGGAVDFMEFGFRSYVIGVDYDSYNEGLYGEKSSVVLTSAVKFYDRAVYSIIKQYASGDFPGGKMLVFDLNSGGVGLPGSNPGLSTETLSFISEINNLIDNGSLVIPTFGEFPTVFSTPIPSFSPLPLPSIIPTLLPSLLPSPLPTLVPIP